jgi:predicted GNAT family acetyltransferase
LVLSGSRSEQIEVRDNPDAGRYEISVDGVRAGFARYTVHDGRITFPHTEVDESRSGAGLGSTLVHAALADARRRGLQVVPICPFVASIIRQNPDAYLDLVVPELRARVMRDEPAGRSV